MDKQMILSQINFVETRIKELEIEVLQTDPGEKGRKELIEGYNKWVDRLTDLYDKLENLDKPDIDAETLKLEREKLEWEKVKFQQETENQKKSENRKTVMDGLGIAATVAVPVIGIAGAFCLAKLAYAKDNDLELCNGRIWGLLRTVTPKV